MNNLGAKDVMCAMNTALASGNILINPAIIDLALLRLEPLKVMDFFL